MSNDGTAMSNRARKTVLAASMLALVAVFGASCITGVEAWDACDTSGDRTGTDGTYVLVCDDGTWVPIMTVEDFVRVKRGEPREDPVPSAPTSTTTSTTTTSTTTTTTLPEGVEVIDMQEASATVGDSASNVAVATMDATHPDGHTVYLRVTIADTNSAIDGGYHFGSYHYALLGEDICYYEVLSVRARATIADTTYRLDWDGSDPDGEIPLQDMPGPWDLQNGDEPTVIAESITLNWNAETCDSFI